MTKTIQKNALVIGGLFLLAQVAIVPVTRADVFVSKPTYLHAATSADPITFTLGQHLTLGETAIRVTEAWKNVTIGKVEDLPEPTAEDIRTYVLAEVKRAGLNAREVEAIISCESRWDDQAKGYNRNGSYDLGLWQINSIHKNISDGEKLDYKAATKWAIAKRLEDGNWSAWYCARRIAKAQPSSEWALNDYNW
jgi:hypothetical protein